MNASLILSLLINDCYQYFIVKNILNGIPVVFIKLSIQNIYFVHQEGFEPSVRFFLELSNFLTAIPQQNVANSPIYRSLLLHYVLCFRGNRTTHTSQHHCSFLLRDYYTTISRGRDLLSRSVANIRYKPAFVGLVGVEPTRLEALDPKSSMCYQFHHSPKYKKASK